LGSIFALSISAKYILEEKNKKSIFRQINETFAAVIRGQLLTSLTQAVVAGIVFWILGLPLPLFFAAVTFLAGRSTAVMTGRPDTGCRVIL